VTFRSIDPVSPDRLESKKEETLATLKWNTAQSVYLPEIDAEHREIYRLLEDLRQASGGADAGRLRASLKALLAEMKGHFAHEEREMELARYAGLEWHRRQHEAAVAHTMRLARKAQRGDREALTELIAYVGRWMEDHMSVSDRMMGAYLRNFRRAAPPAGDLVSGDGKGAARGGCAGRTTPRPRRTARRPAR
jgi:hemerythrin-like metal-binding protein